MEHKISKERRSSLNATQISYRRHLRSLKAHYSTISLLVTVSQMMCIKFYLPRVQDLSVHWIIYGVLSLRKLLFLRKQLKGKVFLEDEYGYSNISLCQSHVTNFTDDYMNTNLVQKKLVDRFGWQIIKHVQFWGNINSNSCLIDIINYGYWKCLDSMCFRWRLFDVNTTLPQLYPSAL
jgi:hypothetical protein